MGHSKSGLFLMELIIAIAFFAFSSAICIQLFAKAHTLSAKSVGVNMAIANAQSAAECFKATDGDAQAMTALLGAASQDGTLTALYDESWAVVPQNGRYRMTMATDTTVVPAQAVIVVDDTQRGEELYRLTVKKYLEQ